MMDISINHLRVAIQCAEGKRIKQEFLTNGPFFSLKEMADEAARLQISGLPHSKQGMRRMALRQGWLDHSTLSRKRKGKGCGGGLEYHVSLVPENLLIAISKDMGIPPDRATFWDRFKFILTGKL